MQLRAVRLEAFGDQDAPRGAHGSLSIAAFDASAEFHDVTAQLCIWRDLPHEPLELNGLVCKYRPAIAHPELKTDHRSFGGEVRCGQSEKKRGSVRSACDEAAVACRRSELGVMMHRIGVADREGIVADNFGRERDYGRKPLVWIGQHCPKTTLGPDLAKGRSESVNHVSGIKRQPCVRSTPKESGDQGRN
jgi:hypothetical protein